MCRHLRQRKLCGEAVSLFSIGGLAYVILEILWRGYSHWTMFVTGGLCVVLVCEMDRRNRNKTAFFLRCFYGALIITAVEFFVGCIVNLWLQWNIWDYSRLPLNLLGQVSLPFTGAWMILSAPVIEFGVLIRKLWGDEPPSAKPIFYRG